MTPYQILYWHDIPSQVRSGERRERVSVPLSQRFQDAIDSAAMLAGMFGSEDYTSAFQWGEAQQRDGTPQEVANAVAAELEATYSQVDVRKTAESVKGIK